MSSIDEPPFIRRRKARRPLTDDLSEIKAPLVLLAIAALLLGFSFLLAYRLLPLGFWDQEACVGFHITAHTCQNGLSALGALTSLLGLFTTAVGGVLAAWTALDLRGRARALAWGTTGASAAIVAGFVIWAIALELF